MVHLAIDLGNRRTGLAVGDGGSQIATPLGIIETATDTGRLAGIEKAIREHKPDLLLLGCPFNMDGTIGPAAKKSERFAGRLAKKFGLPVELVDERLTSYAADQSMAQTGLSHKQKKNRRDALAAAAILRSYWQGHTA